MNYKMIECENCDSFTTNFKNLRKESNLTAAIYLKLNKLSTQS